MFNTLMADMNCPYCGRSARFPIQFKWGLFLTTDFHIGEKVVWSPDEVNNKQELMSLVKYSGRPAHGNALLQQWISLGCNVCNTKPSKDAIFEKGMAFIEVRDDVLVDVLSNSSRAKTRSLLDDLIRGRLVLWHGRARELGEAAAELLFLCPGLFQDYEMWLSDPNESRRVIVLKAIGEILKETSQTENEWSLFEPLRARYGEEKLRTLIEIISNNPNDPLAGEARRLLGGVGK